MPSNLAWPAICKWQGIYRGGGGGGGSEKDHFGVKGFRV